VAGALSVRMPTDSRISTVISWSFIFYYPYVTVFRLAVHSAIGV
jgi:hypothetical protein